MSYQLPTCLAQMELHIEETFVHGLQNYAFLLTLVQQPSQRGLAFLLTHTLFPQGTTADLKM